MNTSKSGSVSKTLIYSREKFKNQSKPKTLSNGSDCSRTSDKPYKRRKPKEMKTNHKGPMKIWVPKSEIVFASDLHSRKAKAAIMVPGQWLLMTYDRRKAYVPNPDSERGRYCGV